VVLVCGDAEVACWPLPAVQNPDILVVDQLARLQLAARRLGCSLRLRGAPSRLRELIDLTGLSDIVADDAGPVSRDPDGPAGEPDDAGPAPGGPG
jgi:ABC-type transporter Mla MlaB component